jgi:hypothetical protein
MYSSSSRLVLRSRVPPMRRDLVDLEGRVRDRRASWPSVGRRAETLPDRSDAAAAVRSTIWKRSWPVCESLPLAAANSDFLDAGDLHDDLGVAALADAALGHAELVDAPLDRLDRLLERELLEASHRVVAHHEGDDVAVDAGSPRSRGCACARSLVELGRSSRRREGDAIVVASSMSTASASVAVAFDRALGS